jgi:AbrB family looped-hinge helix DNA binding protein
MAHSIKNGRTTISSKHQITIPVEALRRARLAPGDRLDVEVAEDGSVVLRRATNPFDEFAGALSGVYPDGYLEGVRGEWD